MYKFTLITSEVGPYARISFTVFLHLQNRVQLMLETLLYNIPLIFAEHTITIS